MKVATVKSVKNCVYDGDFRSPEAVILSVSGMIFCFSEGYEKFPMNY